MWAWVACRSCTHSKRQHLRPAINPLRVSRKRSSLMLMSGDAPSQASKQASWPLGRWQPHPFIMRSTNLPAGITCLLVPQHMMTAWVGHASRLSRSSPSATIGCSMSAAVIMVSLMHNVHCFDVTPRQHVRVNPARQLQHRRR